jgi:hypothetical protein
VGWVVSAKPRPLYPWKETRYPLCRRPLGSQDRTGRVGKTSLKLGSDSRTVDALTCMTEYKHDAAVPCVLRAQDGVDMSLAVVIKLRLVCSATFSGWNGKVCCTAGTREGVLHCGTRDGVLHCGHQIVPAAVHKNVFHAARALRHFALCLSNQLPAPPPTAPSHPAHSSQARL